jgi:uncharacterized protein YdiU (UPF0061 family)
MVFSPEWRSVNSFAGLPSTFYSRVTPVPLGEPRLLHVNPQVAALLDLSPEVCRSPEFLSVFSGSAPLPGGDTVAAVYSGHQFGVWAGQLGDGRAHLLGEVATSTGRWELQLKGSGRTPYSRMGDGRAVLRSSVREYLAGEAMAGLGIPTSRALALVVSNDPVYRETVETAAVVTRVAPCFLRFGSFEHWYGQPDPLRRLARYVLENFYPDCIRGDLLDDAVLNQSLLVWLRQVAERTARLIAQWQTVGFCHGVMNTDNMSVLGLTIDYGPYGFMDAFQADHVCNHSDTQGRYAWNAQPSVANWNLYRLAGVFTQLGIDTDDLKSSLAAFEPAFMNAYQQAMAAKLGLRSWQAGDEALVDGWWGLLHHQQADFTRSFRSLSAVPGDPASFLANFTDPGPVHDWLDDYLARLSRDARPDAERVAQMHAVNPVYVLRNYLAEQAIQAAQRGDASEIDTLLTLLADPFTERAGYQAYAAPPPAWATRLQVSCSS